MSDGLVCPVALISDLFGPGRGVSYAGCSTCGALTTGCDLMYPVAMVPYPFGPGNDVSYA